MTTQDITNNNLSLALLDQKVAGTFRDKRYAYVPVITSGGYGLGIAVEGESGYNPISGVSYGTYAEADEIADGMNAHIGLSEPDSARIVASTMRKG